MCLGGKKYSFFTNSLPHTPLQSVSLTSISYLNESLESVLHSTLIRL